MRLVVVVVAMFAVAACANANPDSSVLDVTPSTVAIVVGETATVTATSGAADPTNAAWASDAPDVATVTPTGETATITGVARGHATITLQLGVARRTVDVTVGGATIDRIDVTATQTTLPRGTTAQLTAIATLSDMTTTDLTATATWATDDPGTATVDPRGVVTAVAPGQATIHATASGVTGDLVMMVSTAQLASIAIAADPTPLAKGLTVQLVATGTFTDTTTADVTSLVTWSSSDDTIATVDQGLVRAVAATGSATITAQTTGPLHANALIAVAPAVVESLSIGPDLQLPLGVTRALTATATLSDATTTDVTSTATWQVASGTAVTVSTAGVVHAASQGAATITATLGTTSDSADASVGPAVADHLAITPGDVALAQQQRVQLHAALVLTDGTQSDLTASAAWSSDAASATVTAGRVDAQAQSGTATITAMASGLTASVHATVGTSTCHPVINEVQAGGISAGDEWVELYNPCTIAFDVSTWTLVYRGATTIGATDTNNLQALAGSMAAGALRLYVGPQYAGAPAADGTAWGGASGLLQATNGAIGLRSGPKDTGPLVDAVAYGTVTAGHPFVETTAAPALANSKSITRAPFDGNDTNTGAADFALDATPTPKALAAP